GTIRARLRKSGQKERSIRLSSVNENIKKIKELLKIEGINSMIYSNKKSFILEINGKHNLQLYLEKIGFENSAKKDLLEKIINPVSFEHILSS
ncbi:MAG: LAGLIDADG family homing endonuclease, partial [Candidatus Woesearchaeota archaeon]